LLREAEKLEGLFAYCISTKDPHPKVIGDGLADWQKAKERFK